MTEGRQSEELLAKTSVLYEECLRAGTAPVFGRGTFRISTEGFPPGFAEKVLELQRRPIERCMLKADDQLCQTKEHLRRPQAHGLLLLVNEARVSLDPAHFDWLVGQTVQRHRFTGIDSIVLLTVNLPARHPQLSRDVRIWLERHLSLERRCSDTLLGKLRTAWFTHFSQIVGGPVWTVPLGGVGQLANVLGRRGVAEEPRR